MPAPAPLPRPPQSADSFRPAPQPHWRQIVPRIALIGALLLSTLTRADEPSHRRLAGEVLDVVNTSAALRAGIKTGVTPTLETLRGAGAPEAAIKEVRAEMEAWAEHDLVWAEIKPRLVDLYVREFTEAELAQLLAFYKSPLGQKALNRFPAIFAEGGRIGMEYAESKQPLLSQRLEKIADKYGAGHKAPTTP